MSQMACDEGDRRLNNAQRQSLTNPLFFLQDLLFRNCPRTQFFDWRCGEGWRMRSGAAWHH